MPSQIALLESKLWSRKESEPFAIVVRGGDPRIVSMLGRKAVAHYSYVCF